MKKILTYFAAVLLTASLWAQTPEKLSYQAVIRNSSDALVTNTQIGIQITILQGSTIGTEVYVETQIPTTNANGLISIEIGAGTVISGDFTTIDWTSGPYFIKTETALEAPLTTYTITGTSQLLSVPYALHAKTAETVAGGITETDPVVAANFSLTGAANGDLLQFNGTKWVKVTPGYISDYTVTKTDVKAHQAALSVTENQISDLDHFTTGDETDPVYKVSVASGITATDTTNWNNKPDSESDPVFTAWDRDYDDLTNTPTTITTSQADEIVANTAKVGVTNGTEPGEMQYWDGTAWVIVAATRYEGATLQMIGGVPTWVGGTTVPDAPTIGAAKAGDGLASVAYTAPTYNGNSTITSYTATSSPGGFTGTLTQAGSGTIVITGLTNGIAYTFTVTATNATGTSDASAASDSVMPEAMAIAIGDSYQGGIIAYILQLGDPGFVVGEPHGFIAAPTDLSTAAEWGCYGQELGTNRWELGTGYKNTSDIIHKCRENGFAAKIASELVLGGYSDWYLPSKDELHKLYLNRVAVGGFENAYYWSSSEGGMKYAWRQDFGSGKQLNDYKYSAYRVRVVRDF